VFHRHLNEYREYTIAFTPLITIVCAITGSCAVPRGLAVVIAGGGTGGHLFPGIAIAEAFLACHERCQVLFIGTDRPFEREILSHAGFDHKALTVMGIKGLGIAKQLRALAALPVGLWQAARHLHRFGPDLVVGVGGYSAGPVALAAFLQGIPVVLHEQNSIAGLTNRLLAPLARRIYLSFEDTCLAVNHAKLRSLGNPVRCEVLETNAPKATTVVTDPSRPLHILILGGSQGAHIINSAVVAMLPKLPDPKRFRFVHQTGTADAPWVEKAYQTAGIAAEVSAFFHNMGRRYREADLLVCRAGATTIAEVTALGKAAIFIPFAAATDDHQAKNARALVARGAAQMVLESELSGRQLAVMLMTVDDDRQQLSQMAQRCSRLGNRHAARDIVEDCCNLLAGNDN
jgi:UDP-N-acetylglucosamine--N-acetylmuramyl-(pentapeptide) pyrophosphoryl-undecaprenol N-acetylglucosamine transferase